MPQRSYSSLGSCLSSVLKVFGMLFRIRFMHVVQEFINNFMELFFKDVPSPWSPWYYLVPWVPSVVLQLESCDFSYPTLLCSLYKFSHGRTQWWEDEWHQAMGVSPTLLWSQFFQLERHYPPNPSELLLLPLPGDPFPVSTVIAEVFFFPPEVISSVSLPPFGLQSAWRPGWRYQRITKC